MKCENCGKEHNGSYGSGRFCSKECAKSFSTKNSQGQLNFVKDKFNEFIEYLKENNYL